MKSPQLKLLQINYPILKNESNDDFSVMDKYRGQNANMHACEAALWAYEATGQKDPYLSRAKTLAYSVAKRLVGLTMTKPNVLSNETPFSSKVAGFIWEHYDTEWNIDYEYNKVRYTVDNIFIKTLFEKIC